MKAVIHLVLGLSMLVVTACGPAQSTLSTPPTKPADLRSTSGVVLTPNSAAPTATEAESTPTPNPAPTPTPIPTEEPSPTPVPFTACDALSRRQAEAVIGPLSGDPFPLEYIGPGPELVGFCIFPGELNTASVEVYQYRDAANARAQYLHTAWGEAITGIGDLAYWSESGSTLSILRGSVTVYIMMSFPDGARDQAIQLGRIAVVRIP